MTDSTSIILIILFMPVLLTACAPLQAWERGNLAKPQMALDPHPLQSALRAHNYGSREAAAVGNAAQKGVNKSSNNAFTLLSSKGIKEKVGMKGSKQPPHPTLFPKREVIFRDALKTSASLSALTTAALILPGLLQPTVLAADEDSVGFQYSHYQEGKRNIFLDLGDPFSTSTKSKSFNPIEVDSLHGSAKISLTDRIKFAFNYVQDTWGGATPVATAPAAFKGNKPTYLEFRVKAVFNP
jgi:Protein of unknown function (DUF3570)/Domain of unknown function (DUF4266)